MSEILSVRPTEHEIAEGRLSPDRNDAAVQAVRTDGVVVLEGIVSKESIDTLLERSLQDLERLLNRPDAPFNWTKGNIQQDPPPFPPYLFRDVLVNDIVIGVTKAILGAGLKNGFYSGNTAVQSESRQPVHADEGQLWTNLEHAHPAHALVVNVPLVDMGPENGSTEIWPGTHVDTSISIQGGDIVLPPEVVERRRAERPPLQPVVRAGSVVIRDIRMWHAGMPNRTPHPRPMIAMIHAVTWWPTGKVVFAKGSEPYLEHPDLKWCAEFSGAQIDHIGAVQGFKSELALSES